MANASAFNYDDPFPKRLRVLMEEKNLKQKDLAIEVGVARQSISQYMDGSVQPVASKLSKIADVFGVTTDYLMGRTDARNPVNASVVDKYGLSEKALENLERLHSYKANECLTRAINALLETDDALASIAAYLYFNLEKGDDDRDEVAFRIVYKYGKPGDVAQWGDDYKHTAGLYGLFGFMDNTMYKRVLMISIQEHLSNLLKIEENPDDPQSKSRE